jgi:hypothetical protein
LAGIESVGTFIGTAKETGGKTIGKETGGKTMGKETAWSCAK